MAHYQATATNSRNFRLLAGEQELGELVYEKWYSFSAEVSLRDGAHYQLAPTGFWESKIELTDGVKSWLEFRMGWRGIVIKNAFDRQEPTFLLKPEGLLSRKFVLLAPDKSQLLVAEADFKWSKLKFDYAIETAPEFEKLARKEVLLLVVLHCINYYMTLVAAAA